MAFDIRNRVPYEATIFATDLGSSKKITNRLYFRNQVQTIAPPGYGDPIAAGSSTTTLINAIRTQWLATIVPRLNANYQYNQIVMKAIVGKRYSTPFFTLLAVLPGTPITIKTTTPHGLSTGDIVFAQNFATVVGTDGTWAITVTASDTFTLNGSTGVGSWFGDGLIQVVDGSLEFLYNDLESTIVGATAGGVVGDALPLFSTASIRRLNTGIGKHFRSRLSLSPMSEADSLDGGFTVAQKALMVTALNNFFTPILNGGTDATSGISQQVVVSKALAFATATPFAESTSWCKDITSFVQQRNMGSLTRRKPRLTSVIA